MLLNVGGAQAQVLLLHESAHVHLFILATQPPGTGLTRRRVSPRTPLWSAHQSGHPCRQTLQPVVNDLRIARNGKPCACFRLDAHQGPATAAACRRLWGRTSPRSDAQSKIRWMRTWNCLSRIAANILESD